MALTSLEQSNPESLYPAPNADDALKAAGLPQSENWPAPTRTLKKLERGQKSGPAKPQLNSAFAAKQALAAWRWRSA
jgi:hypothetical protein